MGPRVLAALAAVAVVSGCADLQPPEIVPGIDGKQFRIDGYGLDASLDRGDCSSGKRLIEVNLRNNSEDAYILYQITDYNLTPTEPEEVAGEIPPNGSKTIIFTPTRADDSVSATVVQLRPDGVVVDATKKIQGLEPRAC